VLSHVTDDVTRPYDVIVATMHHAHYIAYIAACVFYSYLIISTGESYGEQRLSVVDQP